MRRIASTFCLLVGLLVGGRGVSAQSSPGDGLYYLVANTRPPDAYLALRTHPSSAQGERIAELPNGTRLQVLQRQSDDWWYVRVVATGQTGWALSRGGNTTWIICCAPPSPPLLEAPVRMKP